MADPLKNEKGDGMAGLSEARASIIQNLKDAECNEEMVTALSVVTRTGNQFKLLSKQ